MDNSDRHRYERGQEWGYRGSRACDRSGPPRRDADVRPFHRRSPGPASRYNDPNSVKYSYHDDRRFDRLSGRGSDARKDGYPYRQPLPYKDRWHSRSRSPRPFRDGSRGERDLREEQRQRFPSRDGRQSSVPRQRKQEDGDSDREPGELGSYRQDKRQDAKSTFPTKDRYASPFRKKRNRSPSAVSYEKQEDKKTDDAKVEGFPNNKEPKENLVEASRKAYNPGPTADELVARINNLDEDLTTMRTQLAEIELEQIRLEAEEPRSLKALEKAQEVPRPVAPDPVQGLSEDDEKDEDHRGDDEDEELLMEGGSVDEDTTVRSKSKRQYRSAKKTLGVKPCQTVLSSRERLFSRLGHLLSTSAEDGHCKSILSESSDLAQAAHSRFAHLNPISLAEPSTRQPMPESIPLTPAHPPSGVSVVLQREFEAILRAHVASAIHYRSRLEWWKKKELQRRVAIAAATPQLSTGSGGGYYVGGDIDGGVHTRRALSGRGISTSSMELPTSPSLGRSASRGLRADIVRSDLEERQAIAVLNAVDALKHMVDLPTMALTSPRAARWTLHYIDRNRLVCDPVKEMQIHSWTRPWNEEEKEIFAEKFLTYHKDFVRIASFLPERTIPEVIRHYYAVQRSDDFELTRRKYQLKKRRDRAEENAQVVVASTTKSQCIAGYIVPTARLKAPQIASSASPFCAHHQAEETSLGVLGEVQSVVLGNLKRSNSRNSGMVGNEDSTEERKLGERTSSGTSRGGSAGFPLLDSTSRLFSPQRQGRKRGRGRGRGQGRSLMAQRERGKEGFAGNGAQDATIVLWKAVPVYPAIEIPLPVHRKPRTLRSPRTTFVTLLPLFSQALSLQQSFEDGGASGSEAEVTAAMTAAGGQPLQEGDKDIGEGEGIESEEEEEEEEEEEGDAEEATAGLTGTTSKKSSFQRRPSAVRDAKFVEGIRLYGTKWSLVAAHMGNRTGGSARLYWARHAKRLGLSEEVNTVQTNTGGVKDDEEMEEGTKEGFVNDLALKEEGAGSRRGKPSYWSAEEKSAIVEAYSTYGRNWERLQAAVPTKTLTQIRNYYQNYRSKVFEPIVLPPGAVGPRRKHASFGSVGKAQSVAAAMLSKEMIDKGKGPNTLVQFQAQHGSATVPNLAGSPFHENGLLQHQIQQYQQQQALVMHLMAQPQQQAPLVAGGLNGQANNEQLAKFVALMKSNPAAALQFQAQALLMVQMAQHAAQHAAQRDQCPVPPDPSGLPVSSLPPRPATQHPAQPKEDALTSPVPSKASVPTTEVGKELDGGDEDAVPAPQEMEDGGPAEQPD